MSTPKMISPAGPQQLIRNADGPAAAKALEQLRQLQENRNLWPYPWVYPPDGSQRRNPFGSIVVPALATLTQVLAYKVPEGLQFELTEVMFCPVATAFAPIGNPGDFSFTVNRNFPATGTALQASPLADLQNVPFPMGSPIQGPVRLARSENFKGNQIIRVYVTNNSFASTGAPNYVVAQLFGYERK